MRECAFTVKYKSGHFSPETAAYQIVWNNNSIPDNTVSELFDDTQFYPDIDFVREKPSDYIIKLGSQQHLTQWKKTGLIFGHHRNTIRLTTSLVDELGEQLFNHGLVAFLSTETQCRTEADIGVYLQIPWLPPHKTDHIDLTGAYDEYYSELFFHIPFLIAHHLNANQKFERPYGGMNGSSIRPVLKFLRLLIKTNETGGRWNSVNSP